MPESTFCLANFSDFRVSKEKSEENSKTNIAIPYTFRSRGLIIRAYAIPCDLLVIWQNFQVSCIFPDKDFSGAIFRFPCEVGTLKEFNFALNQACAQNNVKDLSSSRRVILIVSCSDLILHFIAFYIVLIWISI